MDLLAPPRRSIGTLLASSRAGVGVVAGLMAAACFIIGAPIQALAMLLGIAAITDWAAGLAGGEDRIEGFAVGTLVGLAVAKGMLGDAAWPVGAALAGAPLGLAIIARRVAGRAHRVAAAIALGGAALTAAIALAR